MTQKEKKVFYTVAEVIEHYMPEPIDLDKARWRDDETYSDIAKRIVDELLEKAKKEGIYVESNPRRWKRADKPKR